MKIEDVVRCWARGESAVGSKLVSNGVSLFSHGWYEIGRRVGDGIIFYRHEDESYSKSTRRHRSVMLDMRRANNFRIIAVRGADGGGIQAANMGQPDWSWVSLCWFFDTTYNRTDGWPSERCIVSIKPDWQLNKRSRDGRMLAFARDTGDVFTLCCLALHCPEYGIIKLDFDEHGNRSVSVLMVPLDCLLPERPECPPAFKFAAPHRDGPEWYRTLFWSVDVADIRRSGVMWQSAFAHGRPPEPLLPGWERDLDCSRVVAATG